MRVWSYAADASLRARSTEICFGTAECGRGNCQDGEVSTLKTNTTKHQKIPIQNHFRITAAKHKLAGKTKNTNAVSGLPGCFSFRGGVRDPFQFVTY